jgi:hypothetical protein
MSLIGMKVIEYKIFQKKKNGIHFFDGFSFYILAQIHSIPNVALSFKMLKNVGHVSSVYESISGTLMSLLQRTLNNIPTKIVISYKNLQSCKPIYKNIQ